MEQIKKKLASLKESQGRAEEEKDQALEEKKLADEKAEAVSPTHTHILSLSHV